MQGWGEAGRGDGAGGGGGNSAARTASHAAVLPDKKGLFAVSPRHG